MKTIQTKTNASNVELTISTFKELTYFIKDNLGDWKITGNLDSLPYELHEAVSNSKTKSKLKKIKKRIFFLKRKVSISKLNKLFEEINSQIIVDISDKEKEINTARKNYKELLNKTRESYSNYKLVKGDYYCK